MNIQIQNSSNPQQQQQLQEDDNNCIKINIIESYSPIGDTEDQIQEKNIDEVSNQQKDSSSLSSPSLIDNSSKTCKNGNSPISRYRSHMPTLNIVSRLDASTSMKTEMQSAELKIINTPESKFRAGKSFICLNKNTNGSSKDSQQNLSKRDLFKQKLQNSSSHLVVNVINTSNSKSSRNSFSSISVTSSQMNSPCLPQSFRIFTLTDDISKQRDLPTFEEKYDMLNQILGEGCSSVVKLCQLKSTLIQQQIQLFHQVDQKLSQPTLINNNLQAHSATIDMLNQTDQLEQILEVSADIEQKQQDNSTKNPRRDSFFKSSTNIKSELSAQDSLIPIAQRTQLIKLMTYSQLKEEDELSSGDENQQNIQDFSPIQIQLDIPKQSFSNNQRRVSQFSNNFKTACDLRKQVDQEIIEGEKLSPNSNISKEDQKIINTNQSPQKNQLQYHNLIKQDSQPSKKFAVKIIRNKDEEYQQISIREFYLLQQLNHPQIAKMHEVYYNKQRETLYFIMDYVEGYTLKNYIRLYNLKHKDVRKNGGIGVGVNGLPEDLCKRLFIQLVQVIEYLHSEKVSVCHRDLNPGNLIINHHNFENEPILTLIDFNVAKRFRDKDFNNKILMMTNTGAAAFSSPEIQKGSSYNENIDIWGAGCALYLMLFGVQPFPQKDQQQLADAIIRGDYNKKLSKWSTLSQDCTDLLQSMLCVDPLERLNINQVIQHPWIASDYQLKSPHNKSNISNEFKNMNLYISPTSNSSISDSSNNISSLSLVLNEKKQREEIIAQFEDSQEQLTQGTAYCGLKTVGKLSFHQQENIKTYKNIINNEIQEQQTEKTINNNNVFPFEADYPKQKLTLQNSDTIFLDNQIIVKSKNIEQIQKNQTQQEFQ
eukprot:403360785